MMFWQTIGRDVVNHSGVFIARAVNPDVAQQIAMEHNMKKQDKVHKVMKEFKGGKLHSGSKSGPQVTSRKQAVAIALSEARKGKK